MIRFLCDIICSNGIIPLRTDDAVLNNVGRGVFKGFERAGRAKKNWSKKLDVNSSDATRIMNQTPHVDACRSQ